MIIFFTIFEFIPITKLSEPMTKISVHITNVENSYSLRWKNSQVTESKIIVHFLTFIWKYFIYLCNKMYVSNNKNSIHWSKKKDEIMLFEALLEVWKKHHLCFPWFYLKFLIQYVFFLEKCEWMSWNSEFWHIN